MCRLSLFLLGLGVTFFGEIFEVSSPKARNDVVEQHSWQKQQERNLFSKTKKGKILRWREKRKQQSPKSVVVKTNIFVPSSLFLYPHTHRIPHSYFAHNGYFFRRQGTHATQFFSSRARLLFASEVPSRVFARRVIFLR